MNVYNVAKIQNVFEIKKYFTTFFVIVIKTVGRLSEKHTKTPRKY